MDSSKPRQDSVLNNSIDSEMPWLDKLTVGQVLRETALQFPTQDAFVFCNWEYA